MANVIITGGTGLIGKALTAALLQKGYSVTVLSRQARPAEKGVQYARWDVEQGSIDEAAVGAADYIVHLAGANVAEKRWTAARKKEIADSRIKSGALLVKALQTIPNKVRAVIASSAIGWYGPDPTLPNPQPFTEEAPPYDDFLGRTCIQWETAIAPVIGLQKRLVYLRTGIVLSNEGGAYPEFRKTLPLHVASVLGSGQQVVSWIHIDDIVGLYLKAIEDDAWHGVYNGVAPQPVSNAGLVKAIGNESFRPYLTVPVPAFALKLLLGEMSIEVLKSTTVSAGKAAKQGYRFRYPDIESAVKALEAQKKAGSH